jgi:hypothetical protein
VDGQMIPISMFMGLTVVLCLFFWFRYRTRNDMQSTIRTAIDKGQELSPEIIDRLGTPKAPKDRDMRLALLWIAIALAMGVFGFVIPDDDNEAQQILFGIAAFPFFIGLAYLIMYRFSDKSS